MKTCYHNDKKRPRKIRPTYSLTAGKMRPRSIFQKLTCVSCFCFFFFFFSFFIFKILLRFQMGFSPFFRNELGTYFVQALWLYDMLSSTHSEIRSILSILSFVFKFCNHEILRADVGWCFRKSNNSKEIYKQFHYSILD